MAHIGWLVSDERNAATVIGLPKYYRVRVANDLRHVFEEIVRSAQHQIPPKSSEPPNKWTGLGGLLIATFLIIFGEAANRRQPNYAVAGFDVVDRFSVNGVVDDISIPRNSTCPTYDSTVLSEHFRFQLWNVGVDEVNTQHHDLWGGILKNARDNGCPRSHYFFPYTQITVPSYGVELAGVDEVNTQHQDLWRGILNPAPQQIRG